MSFDPTMASAAEIEARRQKFIRKAGLLKDAGMFEKILASFPEDMQSGIRLHVEPLLKFSKNV